MGCGSSKSQKNEKLKRVNAKENQPTTLSIQQQISNISIQKQDSQHSFNAILYYDCVYQQMREFVQTELLTLLGNDNYTNEDCQKVKQNIEKKYGDIKCKYMNSFPQFQNEELFQAFEKQVYEKTEPQQNNDILIFSILLERQYLNSMIKEINILSNEFYTHLVDSQVQNNIWSFIEEQLQKETITESELDDKIELKNTLFNNFKLQLNECIDKFIMQHNNNKYCKKLLLWMKLSSCKQQELESLAKLIKKSMYMTNENEFIHQITKQRQQRKMEEQKKHIDKQPSFSKLVNDVKKYGIETNPILNYQQIEPGQQNNSYTISQIVNNLDAKLYGQSNNKQIDQQMNENSNNQDNTLSKLVNGVKGNYISNDISNNKLSSTVVQDLRNSYKEVDGNLVINSKLETSNPSISQIVKKAESKINMQSHSGFENIPILLQTQVIKEAEQKEEDDTANEQNFYRNTIQSNGTAKFQDSQLKDIYNSQKSQTNTNKKVNSELQKTFLTFADGNKSEIKYKSEIKNIGQVEQVQKNQSEIYKQIISNIYVHVDNNDVPISQLKKNQNLSQLLKNPEFNDHFDNFVYEVMEKDPNNNNYLPTIQVQQNSNGQQNNKVDTPSKVLELLGSAII